MDNVDFQLVGPNGSMSGMKLDHAREEHKRTPHLRVEMRIFAPHSLRTRADDDPGESFPDLARRIAIWDLASRRQQIRCEHVIWALARYVVPEGSIDDAVTVDREEIERMLVYTLLEQHGIGGRGGFAGDATARMVWAHRLGSGRKQARDGEAWTAAITRCASYLDNVLHVFWDEIPSDGRKAEIMRDWITSESVDACWVRSYALNQVDRATARAEIDPIGEAKRAHLWAELANEFGVEGDPLSDRWGLRPRPAQLCQCGKITGEACHRVISDVDVGTVTVEWMPLDLRVAHTTANNRGVYPSNGSHRYRMSVDCAARTMADDPEWTLTV